VIFPGKFSAPIGGRSGARYPRFVPQKSIRQEHDATSRYGVSMSQPPELAKKLPTVPVAPLIDIWYRVGAVILGLASLGSGGAAVFIAHVEAGPVALIAAGFLLLLIGASGRLPSRLKIGDNEAEWSQLISRVQETVEAVATSVAEDNKPGIEYALKRLQKVAPDLAESMSSLAFVFVAQNMLNEAITKIPGAGRCYHRVDNVPYYLIDGGNGKRAYYEMIVDTAKAEADSVMADRKNRLIPLLSDVGVDRILFITNGDLPRAMRAYIANEPLIESVSISVEEDLPRLIGTIQGLLELPRPHRPPSVNQSDRNRLAQATDRGLPRSRGHVRARCPKSAGARHKNVSKQFPYYLLSATHSIGRVSGTYSIVN
jgi:hypothetical protein